MARGGRGEELNVRLTAANNASAGIHKVADELDGLESRDPQVKLAALDNASDEIRKVADRLPDLEAEDVKVVMTARADQLRREIDSATEARRELSDDEWRIRIEARNNAKNELARVQAELEEIDRNETKVRVDDSGIDDATASAQDFASTMRSQAEQTEGEMRQTIEVADLLGHALGPGLRGAIGEVELAEIVNDARKAGVEFDDLRANVDQLADAIRRTDDVNVSLGGVSGSFDRIRGSIDSADQSRSVFANAMGNMAAKLGPACGPLNMADGQFLEYASEGNVNLGQMASLAVRSSPSASRSRAS